MSTFLIAVAGLIVAAFVTGGFSAVASLQRRRRKGQRAGGFVPRPPPRRPASRPQARTPAGAQSSRPLWSRAPGAPPVTPRPPRPVQPPDLAEHGAVSRRLIAGVALGALLAGCSGPSGPTAADRSVCKTVRTQLAAVPKNRPLPAYAISESEGLIGSASPESTVVFVSASFVHELIHTEDPTFRRAGEALQRGAGSASTTGRLEARCSALGL